jgi:hypothetical protein
MQTFKALSIEYVLERSIITYAKMHPEAGPIEAGPLKRPPAFNAGSGRERDNSLKGNQTILLGDIPQFGGTYKWSYYDVAKYLLANFVLPDAKYVSTIPIIVDQTSFYSTSTRTAFVPITEQAGRSVKAVLDSLFDHRRMLCWRIEVSPDDTLTFKVYQFDSGTSVNLDAAYVYRPRLKSYSITRDYKVRYDQVQVIGEPIGCVFSMEAGTGDGSNGTLLVASRSRRGVYHRVGRNADGRVACTCPWHSREGRLGPCAHQALFEAWELVK